MTLPTVTSLSSCQSHDFGKLLNIGITSGDSFWLTTEIDGIPRDLALKLSDGQIKSADVFTEKDNVLLALDHYDNPLIAALGLPLPKDPQVSKIYVRIVPTEFLSLIPMFGPPHQFSVQLSRTLALRVMLISAVLVIALLTLFGFVIFRFSFMAYFGLYGLGMTVLLLQYLGLGNTYLWGTQPYVEQLIFVLSHTVTAAFYYFFLMSFMSLADHAPRVHFAFKAGVAFSMFASLLSFFKPTLALPLVPVSGIVSCLLITLAVASTFRKSSLPSRIYLFSAVVYLVFIVLYILNFSGITSDYFLFGFELPVGTTIDTVMLLVAVAVKAKALEDSRLKERDAERLRMEQNNRLASLGLMAGGIAHEINNPLAIIKATTSNLRYVIETGRNDRELLLSLSNHTESTVDRISVIIKSFSLLARGNHLQAPLTQLSLSELRNNIFEVAREGLKLQSASLIDRGWVDDVYFSGNLILLTQVFRNLLANAAELVRNDPNGWIRMDAVVDAESLRFNVLNSGPRIDAALVGQIFDPFFTTKPVGTGMGMGLSICKALIQSLGGKIEVDLDQPHTCFTITLARTTVLSRQRSG